MRACAALLAVGCILLMPGCKNQKSTRYDINEIVVFFEVVTTPEKTVATARFTVPTDDGDVSLYLGRGDEIVVNQQELERRRDESYDYYSAEIPADEAYTFLFRRKDAVYEANVFAPPAVQITEPAPDARLSRAAGFNVAWSGAQNDRAAVEVNGEKIVPYSQSVLDAGFFAVPPGKVEATEAADTLETPAVVAVTRSNWSEALSPEMDGVVVARMRAEVPAVSVP